MAFSSKFQRMKSDAPLTAHSSPCPGQGKGFRSSSLPSQGLPGLQLCHCYCENPSLVLRRSPRGFCNSKTPRHPQPPHYCRYSCSRKPLFGGRRCCSMGGMWDCHFLARVTRCQARRGLEVPPCMEVPMLQERGQVPSWRPPVSGTCA